MDYLSINGYKIKKPSGVINVFSKLQDKNIVIEGNKDNIIELLEISDEKITSDEVIEIFKEHSKNIRSIIKYISNNKSHVDVVRLNEFIKYKEINPTDSNSETILKLMYGDKIGKEKFKIQQTKFSKYYDINYYIGLGFSEQESINKVIEYKKNKRTTIDNFVKKYGKKIGKQKYSEYVNKSKNTIENFKIRYGGEWKEKWGNYVSKDSSSLNWALKRANGDIELSKQIFNEKLSKTTVTLEFLQNKYGETEGLEKWNEINRKKNTSEFNYFLEKYIDYDLAKKKYEELNRKKDSSSLNFFIKKYGDEGHEKYVEKCKLSDNKSLKYFIEKYGDNEEAYSKYIETQELIKVKHLTASKSSLMIFKPLYNYLINNKIIEKEDIFLGIEGSNEFFLKNERNIYFYDFTIKSKKLIIEFNGKVWHPNWEKYNIKECVEKFNYKTLDPLEAIKKDKNKIELANKNGFDVLILWEEDGLTMNQQKLKKFLNEKKINYED